MDVQSTTKALPILVTGGTGRLGRLVVADLKDAGRRVRVLSRGRKVVDEPEGVESVTADLSTGEGVEAAVRGAEIIVHCAGSAKGDADKARTLVRTASRAGVRHIVYIAVIGDDEIPIESGIDRMMFGYFAEKRTAEQIVADSGIPWTTLHATQFYDAMFSLLQTMAKLPVIPVPSGFRFQPIDEAEVASTLVQLALGAPAGRVPEMAGPRVYEMADLIRAYFRASGKNRPIISVPTFGKAAAAFRAGANLAPDHAVGRRTWEEFLEARLGSLGDKKRRQDEVRGHERRSAQTGSGPSVR
jgi:uncharacterized protein YbjT (DUF2867 family)